MIIIDYFQWPESSERTLSACIKTLFLSRICQFSATALGLPGKLIIRVCSRIPATALDKHARGVILSDSMRINCMMDYACLSITASVASGVTSLGANPVPPDVNISLTPLSASLISSF